MTDNHTTEHLDITQHEIEALKQIYNLADAHTHQSQSISQKKIIKSLPKIWYESESMKQHEVEEKFIRTFFETQWQYWALKPNNAMILYASSISIVVTANYMMKKGLSCSILTPVFDNLVDIMKHMKINLNPIDEELLYDPHKIYQNLVKHCKTDCLFLVDPNNPTWFSLFNLWKKAYEEVIRFCVDHKKTLILDFCFAPFFMISKDVKVFDVYELLHASKVTFIAYEDTGKTRPTQDMKASILKTSTDIYKDVYDITTSYLLNVSPFILNVLIEYMNDSDRTKFASTFNLLNTNRSICEKTLKWTILQVEKAMVNVPVVWAKITDKRVKATDLQKFLKSQGVYILPGTYFFRENHERWESFVRIALARNTKLFTKAMKQLRIWIDKYMKLLVK